MPESQIFDIEPLIGGPDVTDTFHCDIVARRSVLSSVSTDRVRDCPTDPVLRRFCVDTGAIVACEAGFADVAAIAGHGDHPLGRSTR